MKTYSTSQVNRDFKIKVYDRTISLNSLRGVSGLVELIGSKLAEEFISRAYNSGKDVTTCRVFAGNKPSTLKVTFYVH